jgi:hypothetical protein
VPVLRIEKRLRRAGVGQPPADQDLREHMADPQLAFQPQGGAQVIAGDLEPRGGRRRLGAGMERQVWAGKLDRVWAKERCLGHGGQRMGRS